MHAAARLDQGQLTLRPQAVEVAGLVAELDAALRTWTAHKALAWHCTLAADVPAVLWLDPMRVRQVAINLLSNAVKYTAAGSIRLDLSLDTTRSTASTTASASACAAPAVLLISVTDTGVGIDNQRLDRLFTPYASTTRDTSTSGERSGTSTLSTGIRWRPPKDLVS